MQTCKASQNNIVDYFIRRTEQKSGGERISVAMLLFWELLIASENQNQKCIEVLAN